MAQDFEDKRREVGRAAIRAFQFKVAPLVSLIALGRAYFLLRKSEQNDLRDLVAPALQGLTRSGATILLVTAVPGEFLLHLGRGIVISLAHSYIWGKASENKGAMFAALKQCLNRLTDDFTPA